MKGFVSEIIFWLILGSLTVLVITHPNGFSSDVSTVGSQTTNVMTLLTGSGKGS